MNSAGLIFALLVTAAMLAALGYALTDGRDVGEGAVAYVRGRPVRLWLDPETGCEYFADGYRPRLGSDGRQMCGAEGVTKP